MSPSGDWQPTATRSTLEQRARLLSRARAFFAGRGVLEVDTPIVVNAPVTDVHIHSAQVNFASQPRQRYFLHTSPEFAMKRLLAAGSGDIFQICHVVRDFERGRWHNPEFTLIEWYRVGFSLEQLMDEVAALVTHLLEHGENLPVQRLSYRQVFADSLGLEPLECARAELEACVASQELSSAAAPDSTRDDLLDLLMGSCVGPRLGHDTLTFVHGYPASQAALARLDPQDPRTALRFELYHQGVELANGFQELASAAEQRERFERDQAERKRRGLPVFAADERLLAALAAGLPECAGVALGFDRLLMLATSASHIDEVLAFPQERA